MRVVAVPCLSDNYAYLVIDGDRGEAAVVDPSEAAPVQAAAAREGVRLVAVWLTHHHPDHVGGVDALRAAVPGLTVVGFAGDRERLPALDRAVDDGDEVRLGAIAARVIHNPGHTRGAISFHVVGSGDGGAAAGALFTGDTLFGAGCGRLFEGTPAQMFDSLARLAALPGSTRVYCGHEYTAQNLRFAAAVEPESPAVRERTRAIAALAAAGKPSVPFTLLGELTTNPFLRAHLPEVAAAARAQPALGLIDDTPVEVFAALRRWKDGFR